MKHGHSSALTSNPQLSYCYRITQLEARPDEMECPVCFNETRGHKRSSALPCGHVTCKTCVADLRDLRCPICREIFDAAKVLDLFL